MKKLITLFVKYKFYANLILIFLVVAGGMSYLGMKKSFFPERASRDITIRLTYPGASPKEMEESMTARVEQAVRGIVGIKEINSVSLENMSTVTITTTGEFDLDETLTEVKNAVDAISSFPVDMERPVVSKRRAITQAMYMALSGDVDLFTLKKYAQEIEDDFLASNVVSQVSISGFPAAEISVETSEETLLRYNLTFDEIARAISANNRDFSAGLIRSSEEEMLIRSRSRSVKPADISDIVIRADPDGKILLVRDVARVKLQFSEVSSATYLNGKRAVSISVSKLANEDLEEISTYCRAYAEEFNATHKGVTLTIPFDFMEILKSRLNLLYRNGGLGLILVMLTLGLFLSTRLSFWVAWGIPASFLAMSILAASMGITINMISLFGMILVIGILVDDGIVIAENIYTHFESGKSPKRAAIDGTMEVMPAVVTSVATTIVAFSPLLLLEGMFEFFYEMGFVVIFSLFFSLLEAFFVLPAHVGTSHVLRVRKRRERGLRIRQRLEKAIDFIRFKLYGGLLKRIIHWKWVVLAMPLAILIITIGLFSGGFLRYTYFPTIPFDNFTINMAFKPGTGEALTKRYLEEFDNAVWQVNDELKKKYSDPEDYISDTYRNLGYAFDGEESGSHAGNVMVLLRDMEGAPISSFQIAEMIRAKIGKKPELEKFSIGGRNRWGKPVSISLLGKDMNELRQAKTYVLREMEKMENLINVTSNDVMGRQEVLLKLKPKAYFLGLEHSSIANQVRQGFYGGQAQRLQSGKDELRVWVRYPQKDRYALGQLESMKIKTPAGLFPLSELADYTIRRGPVSIHRYNLAREIRLEADMLDPYASVPLVLEKMKQGPLAHVRSAYPGVRIVYQGQRKESDQASADMLRLFLIAFSVIVIILMIHFRSFSQPLLILVMIPLSWLGASWGHGFEGIPVSMLSAWGMVALSGVVINDAVVFVSKYNRNLLKGMTVKEAVYDAGIARLRPILLTTITTVVGLYPIVLEGSFQSQFLKPMAIALAYGVLFGTLFILLFLPVFILAMNEFHQWVYKLRHGKRPENSRDVEVAVVNDRITID